MPDKDVLQTTREMLPDLLRACPYHLGESPQCLFHQFRALPHSERVEWVQNLTDEECQAIYIKHIRCPLREEGGLP